ncbi:MAG: clostripain-related cysteine peptidase [bacterium]|nr:clostripain-related cysteine peptidase [bacterium]
MKKFLSFLVLFIILALFVMGQSGCIGCGPTQDTVKPVVVIAYPYNGQTVSGIVVIQATASDNVGIAKVEFYIDGGKVGDDNSSPYEYSWNTDSLTLNSNHTIQAKAYDNAGNIGESPIITVIIGDTQAPLITITSPGSIIPGSAIVQIQAQVIDRDKKGKIPTGIQKVEFYVDGNKIGEDLISPYQCNWDTSGLKHNTVHTITVKAKDNSGNVGEASTSVTINVEWTILWYIDGHNNLGPYFLNELNRLYNVTSTDSINILILAGLSETNPLSYLYYFHNGTFQTLAQGNYNFGDPATLQNFLSYGIQNFPAKKYLLIIGNHGSGWRKKVLEENLVRDICWDDIHGGASISMPELKSVLQSAVNLLGRKIDLLYFDACCMGTIEVDYEIKDLVSYLVSSEAVGWVGITRWDTIFNQLVSSPTMSPGNLGKLIAQTYFSNYSGVDRTIAVKDLSKIDTIVNDIYYFAHYLRDCVSASASAIMYWRNQTQSFAPYSNYPSVYIDLYQFANHIADHTSYNNLQNAALTLMSDIESSTLWWGYAGYSSAKGYSIWFPANLTYYNDGYTKYSALDFAQSTKGHEWFLFLYEELTALASRNEIDKTVIER